MRKLWFGLAALGLLVGLVAGAFAFTRPAAPAQVRARLAVADVLGGESGNFARALSTRPFVFPADHGPHPEYRTEWWYFTGNLDTPEGRHFGYQLTFFRSALRADAPERGSDWAANQVYMAHFALSDVGGGRFFAHERFARGALDLAGAQAEPVRVWLEDWSVAEIAEPAPFAGQPALRLRAAQGEVAIDLLVRPGKPVVLQGERGLSAKGPEPGNASYYYSLTRLATEGTVTLGGQALAVGGASWLDREWSTSVLGAELVGWDWFALQLDDGRELMYFRLRRRDGAADPFSAGTLVAADGTYRSLSAAEVLAEPLDYWTSPRDGARYPARWRLAVPVAGLELEASPYLADQELDVSVRYWEGAVRLRGTGDGPAVAGQGYVEMTGYADQAAGLQGR
ncbi:MAG: lipocalin-like domain-containing protein [Chloroflexota bacterium]